MEKEFEGLPNWVFRVDEASARVYNIKGREWISGSNFDLSGTHSVELFRQAREIASQMDQQTRRRLN